LLAVLPASDATAGPSGPAEILWHQKISATQGGFTRALEDLDYFGIAVAALGDLDGDGAADFGAGASADDDGGSDRGAVYVLFVEGDGSVVTDAKISMAEGDFAGELDDNDQFGFALACPGDLDGDGTADLTVGAPGDDDGGTQHGAFWVLFLHDDGSVKSHAKVSATEGGFTGSLDDYDYFGWSLAAPGDLDGDGVADLAAGSPFDDDGGPQRGAVWILFMNEDGTVKDQRKISATEGNLADAPGDGDLFGMALAGLGDLDGDSVDDLAASSGWVDDGGTDRGAIWILFMNADGTVKASQRISGTTGEFTGVLENSDHFGSAVVAVGDLDGDGVTDLAAGARGDDDGGQDHGAVWVLFLESDGTVKDHAKISDTAGGFNGILDTQDEFGSALTWLGDPDADGASGLVVGAYADDDGGIDHGAAWVLFLAGVPGCPADCSDGDGLVTTADLLALLGQWGEAAECDLDGNGLVGTADLLALLANWGPCPH
jgi:hypothetical protein